MKIITCASYYGSGSSALTDLVAEYDNVKDLSSFEFRFLHDIDGVSDLEYHLVDNPNRHNSGHALKRFIKLSEFNEGNFFSQRYSAFLNINDYRKITNTYIERLSGFCFRGWWFYDLYDKGPITYFAYQLLNHIFRRIPIDNLRIMKNELTYCPHPSREEFLKATREYVSDLMQAMNREGKEYLEIDQIVPSSNINKVLRYFENEIFVFVVDRDPRDIYFLCKYYWKDGVSPKDSVEEFCKWYRFARNLGETEYNNQNIVKIQFEDIVYRYEEVVRLVENITGLNPEHHTEKYKKMNPQRSAHNTQVWKRHTQEKDLEDLKYIENELSEYLYNYSNVDCNKLSGEQSLEQFIF